MRRLPLVVIAVLALAGFGGGAQKSAPLLGFVYAGGQSWRLAPIDPLTLSRRPGRSLSVGDSFSAWSYSPDRSKLVLGRGGIGGELLLVDTRRMRRLGLVETGGMAQLTATFWPVETRVYAVVTPVTRQTDGNLSRSPTRLVAVDPLTRTVVGEQVLDGSFYGSAHGPGVLTLLLGQETGVGPARLAVVGSDGSVRTVGLDGVSVGYDGISEEGPALVGRYAQPGLAVAGDGTRAFVVTPGLVAAVDLRTLQVSYHPVGATGRRLQRVEKGSLDGSYRSALWARGGKLLVTGRDDHSSVDANGLLDYEARPAGLRPGGSAGL